MEAQNGNPSQDGAEKVLDAVGASGEEATNANPEESEHSQETLAVQKRLKSQKRAHDREVRDLHSRIAELESRFQSQEPSYHAPNQGVNPSMPQGVGIDENIHKAVAYALGERDQRERQAQEAMNQAHVHRQYQELQKHLDGMGDKYDDFHDTVMSSSAPFTASMRDYAMTLPRSGSGSAGEVLYKLGKNPEELSRIAKLHPLEQASEMSKLSQALVSGAGNSASSAAKPTLGSIKSNPVVNSRDITESTPVAEIRARMKEGRKGGFR